MSVESTAWVSLTFVFSDQKQDPKDDIHFVENKIRCFHFLVNCIFCCFVSLCPATHQPDHTKKERDNTSTSCLSKRSDWYPYCLMRTGQRESKFVFKIPHTTPLLTGDFSKVTCAGSLRHKGLRFIFCDLPVGDKMILQGRITIVGDRKERQRTAAVSVLRQFFHFRLSNSWCNVLGNYTSYYQISER